MGRGWAKGCTAATDPRIARAAAGHRGKTYARRTPRERCRWPVAGSTTLPLRWSNEMAYVVGLTATDGCLVSGRRAINFKSGDRQLVETYLALLGRTNRIKLQRTRTGGSAYFTQFHDSALYEWFRSVGLTPRKSLTLGAISVPDEFLLVLVRGLLDGDGSVMKDVPRGHRPTRRLLLGVPDHQLQLRQPCTSRLALRATLQPPRAEIGRERADNDATASASVFRAPLRQTGVAGLVAALVFDRRAVP